MLAHVNQVLAEHDVNIGGQVLATRGHTGYVVTDTDSGLSDDVLAEPARRPGDGPAARHRLTGRAPCLAPGGRVRSEA